MKISIVTPNYNYAQFLPKTIESVIEQSFNELEYIIVDDGSNDDSVSIIESYVKKHPFIKLIKQENQGQTFALNKGLDVSTGEIICWINSDDYFCPNIFPKIVNIFEKNPDLDILYGDVNIVDVNGIYLYRKRHLPYNYYMAALTGFGNYFTSNAVFWRRKIMMRNGLPNANLKCNMDGEYFSRLVLDANVKHVNYSVANFRRQPFSKESLKHSQWEKLVKDEINLELTNSFKRMDQFNRIPVRYFRFIKIPFRIWRILNRVVRFHYLLERLEINKNKAKIANRYPN